MGKIAKEYGISPDRINDFSANINPLGPSPAAEKAIREGIACIQRYPDLEYKALREKLAAFYKISEDSIVLGNGGVEVIFGLTAYLRAERALIPSPTFGEYAAAVKANGGEVTFIPMGGKYFALDPEEVKRNLPGHRVLFLCTPNNPTGILISPETLRCLLRETAKTGTVMVVDESFMDFVPENHRFSILHYAEEQPHLMVIRSMTKFFAVPGLRLGFGVCHREMAEKVQACLPPWNINCLAELAVTAALEDTEYQRLSMEYVKKERQELALKLRKIPGIRVHPGTANFLFISVQESCRSSSWWQQALLKHEILVRNCNSYPFLKEGYLRVAVRTRQENAKLVQAFHAVVREIM